MGLPPLCHMTEIIMSPLPQFRWFQWWLWQRKKTWGSTGKVKDVRWAPLQSHCDFALHKHNDNPTLLRNTQSSFLCYPVALFNCQEENKHLIFTGMKRNVSHSCPFHVTALVVGEWFSVVTWGGSPVLCKLWLARLKAYTGFFFLPKPTSWTKWVCAAVRLGTMKVNLHINTHTLYISALFFLYVCDRITFTHIISFHKTLHLLNIGAGVNMEKLEHSESGVVVHGN